MSKIQFLTVLSFIIFLTACGGSQSSTNDGAASEADTSGMAQFAGDDAFKAAHPSPDSLQFQGRGQMIQFDTPDGAKGSAYALPATEPTGKYLLVFHEWWGLNDHIKAESERLFDLFGGKVTVLAPDLYDGKVATSPDQAGELMQAVKNTRALAIVNGALAYAGPDAAIGTIGWCFGGGWSLQASIQAGDRGKACVMYYGMPVQNAKDIAPLKAPVLGIFARQDGWINEEVIGKFEALTKSTNKSLEVHWFDAKHAFANPSNPDFNKEAASEANQLAWNFLKEKL